MSGGDTRRERPGSYRGLELLPIHLYVLAHLKKAGVDYAKMMAKMSELPLSLIEDAIRDLMEVGLVERDSGSAIKRSKARFKKSFEVHKHHTYYRLSREGELFVRKIDEKWLKEYFNGLTPDGWDVIRALKMVKSFSELPEKFKSEDARDELLLHHLITPNGRVTGFFRLLCEFLGI
jgi:predicted transcriptional regulator